MAIGYNADDIDMYTPDRKDAKLKIIKKNPKVPKKILKINNAKRK